MKTIMIRGLALILALALWLIWLGWFSARPPLTIDPAHPFPFIPNLGFSIALALVREGSMEEVAERLDVKQSVFQRLAEQVSPDCILATNTSSLSVTEIAAGVPHPERVVGMHFFNPVKKMPLVEIVLGEQTSREVALSTAALAVRLGKTPVLVKDVAGFLVNRLLGPYLDEAVRLFAAGVAPRRIDDLMLDFGMPMGPLRLLDEVGLARHGSS